LIHYTCSPAFTKDFVFKEEAPGISSLNQGLRPAGDSGPVDFIEVASGRNQRIIAAEKDAFRADNFEGDFVDQRMIEKWRSRCVVIDLLGGPRHFRHELIKEKTSSPMGQYDVHIGKSQEKLVDGLEILQALSGVVMTHRFVGMEQQGNSLPTKRLQDCREIPNLSRRYLVLIKGQFSNSVYS
jgi:hypothetical protein